MNHHTMILLVFLGFRFSELWVEGRSQRPLLCSEAGTSWSTSVVNYLWLTMLERKGNHYLSNIVMGKADKELVTSHENFSLR